MVSMHNQSTKGAEAVLMQLAGVLQGIQMWTAFPSSHQHDASESPRSRSKEGPETQRHKGDKSSRWAECTAGRSGETHSGRCSGAESWEQLWGEQPDSQGAWQRAELLAREEDVWHRAHEVLGDVCHSLCLWHLAVLVFLPEADRDWWACAVTFVKWQKSIKRVKELPGMWNQMTFLGRKE